MSASVWIGFDPREAAAFAVARTSIRSRLTLPIPVRGLVLSELQKDGIYTRPTERREGRLWDTISGAPMATEFAISRFLVPFLADTDWALFMDCDMLVRANLRELFDQADSDKAVMVVKHDHQPTSATKMDGQIQTSYQKKNWSSVILFNCKHPSNNVLTPEFVNTQRGLHLHQFCWLKDEEIGELGQEWNWLAGHSGDNIDPKICHHTDGVPFMPGYEDAPYADEWREVLTRWAS